MHSKLRHQLAPMLRRPRLRFDLSVPLCTLSVGWRAVSSGVLSPRSTAMQGAPPRLQDSHLGEISAPEAPQMLLKEYPDGAYTTMLIRSGEIVDVEAHLKRLSRCMSVPSLESAAHASARTLSHSIMDAVTCRSYTRRDDSRAWWCVLEHASLRIFYINQRLVSGANGHSIPIELL